MNRVNIFVQYLQRENPKSHSISADIKKGLKFHITLLLKEAHVEPKLKSWKEIVVSIYVLRKGIECVRAKSSSFLEQNVKNRLRARNERRPKYIWLRTLSSMV